MWPFHNPQNAAEILEPAPARDLREELRQLLFELRQIDAACRDLRARYRLRINRFSQITGMEADLCEAPKVRETWRTLQMQARPLLTRFHELQREMAEEKTACPQT
jgi:hypothetical protein